MNLAQIKNTLGIVALDLTRTKDQDDKPTAWLRNWNNLNRSAVVIHEDTLALIKANPKLTTLALKSEKRMAEGTDDEPGMEYTNHIIINAENIEETL